MAFDFKQARMGALGSLGAGAGEMFSNWKNPADSAMGELDGVPDTLKQYYMPYVTAGQNQLPLLQGQYGQLLNDPGGRLNQIGQSYQQSPGFDWAKKQGMAAVGNAAAAGGMAGTPQHQQQAAEMTEGIANQDYNNWMHNAMGMYGMGMQGSQDMAHLGYGATDSMTQSLINNMITKAYLKYAGQDAENKHSGGGMGSLISGGMQLASLGGFI